MTEAQTQITDPPPWEKIWAIFQESAKELEETRRLQKETERLQKETAQQSKEWQQKYDQQHEQIARELRETVQGLKETRRIVEQASRQMGLLHNSFGELAEHMVSPSIKEKFNALGYKFDKVFTNVKIPDETGAMPSAEIDIFLENGDFVVIVEVKAKPAYKDITRHVERMELVRRWADQKNDRRKFHGAIAGAIMSDEMKHAILKAGFYPIEQSGDTVAINVPASFTPREW